MGMRAEYGSISAQWPESLKLITLTYGFWGSDTIQRAPDALADFRRFVQRVRRLPNQSPTFRWFRVPEKTKAGQTHWHLISGDLVGNKLDIERALRDAWALATRRKGVINNYVVDVTETTSPAGANYITKYILKGMLQGQWLMDSGFKRRWTCSRDWPKPAQTQLQGTLDGAWTAQSWIRPFESPREIAIGRATAQVSPLGVAVGDPLVELLAKRVQRKVIMKKMEVLVANLPQNTR